MLDLKYAILQQEANTRAAAQGTNQYSAEAAARSSDSNLGSQLLGSQAAMKNAHVNQADLANKAASAAAQMASARAQSDAAAAAQSQAAAANTNAETNAANGRAARDQMLRMPIPKGNDGDAPARSLMSPTSYAPSLGAVRSPTAAAQPDQMFDVGPPRAMASAQPLPGVAPTAMDPQLLTAGSRRPAAQSFDTNYANLGLIGVLDRMAGPKIGMV